MVPEPAPTVRRRDTTGAPRAAEGWPRPRRHTSVRRRAHQADGQPWPRRARPGGPCRADRTTCIADHTHRCHRRRVAGMAGMAELARLDALTPAPGGRARYTPRHRRPQRQGPRHDRAEGGIPSRRGWRPRPRRQRGQMPRASLAPVSGGAGPAASRGQGRGRGPRGHGPRSSSTPGRHLFRPRDAMAASEPRWQRHRGRCAPTQVPAPHRPCADPTVRAHRQASGSESLTQPTRTVLHGAWRTTDP
jgi:hypothetical protein